MSPCQHSFQVNLPLSNISDLLQVLKCLLESADLPDIDSPAAALQRTIIHRAFLKSRDGFTKLLAQVIIHVLHTTLNYLH